MGIRELYEGMDVRTNDKFIESSTGLEYYARRRERLEIIILLSWRGARD